MSTIEERPIDTEQRFSSRWPFFGPWLLTLVELAEKQDVPLPLENLLSLRSHYLNFLEPAEALSNLTGGHQS